MLQSRFDWSKGLNLFPMLDDFEQTFSLVGNNRAVPFGYTQTLCCFWDDPQYTSSI